MPLSMPMAVVVPLVADDQRPRAVWLCQDGAATTMNPSRLANQCSTLSPQHALDLSRELRHGVGGFIAPRDRFADSAAAAKLTFASARIGRLELWRGPLLVPPRLQHDPPFRRRRLRTFTS